MSYTIPKLLRDSSQSTFDEVMTAINTPVMQVTAQYGITSDMVVASLGGGSTSSADSLFICESGTGANGVAAILSDREIAYKAGQGIRCIYSAIFDSGAPQSTQQSGLLTSESAYGFGYNGDEFGIFQAKGGSLEIQELQITTPAAGSENASITVDGILFSVPITAGTVQQNAFEIFKYLNANDLRYRYTSNNDKVTVLARLPEQGAGSFSFSSASAVASFTEISNGVIPPETWVNKANWNVNPDIDINPQLGNVYMVQYGYTGFDGIKFFVKDPLTDKFELVHIIQYGNTTTEVNADNPTFRIGWACRNTGNTSNITIKGSSGGAFIEGIRVIDTNGNGKCALANISSSSEFNVLAFRNRETFNNKANRAPAFVSGFNAATESAKITVFKIYKNPTVSTFLDFQYHDEATSLMEFSTTQTVVTGGEEIACYATRGDISDSLEDLLGYITTGDIYAITASFPSGAASDVLVNIKWKDDF